MKRFARCIVAAGTLLLGATAIQAQTADLRYRMPMPQAVVVTSIDSMTTSMSGLPMGGMNTTMNLRSVTRLAFASAGDSIEVTATLLDFEGLSETPMGNMPLSGGNAEPITLRISESGPAPQDLENSALPDPDSGPGDLMGAGKALSSLLTLPGRELRLGETWTDTIIMKPEVEGMQFDMTVVVNGTYVADTVVAGVELNVLRIEGTMTSSMNGTMRGMNMTQRMTTTSEERVLWNSAQHYPVHREGSSVTEMKTDMPDQNMSMSTTIRGRTITTAQPEG